MEDKENAIPTALQKSIKSGVIKNYQNAKGKIDNQSLVEGVSKINPESAEESALSEIAGNPKIRPQSNPQPDPQPDPQPNPQPDPQPNPQPNPQPDPQPNPQPDPQPNPQPNPQPDAEPDTKVGNDYQWYERFPFCIPWDISDGISQLNANTKEPVFDIPFKIKRLNIDENVHIDFKDYKTLRTICHWFLRLMYILGLALISRYVIKG